VDHTPRIASFVNHLRLTVSDIEAARAFYGAEILDPPSDYDDEPDHYAVFFRDPDGLKLEVLHVDAVS
jgi:catechol 2,3-dioxygenase-like lactoylglutathione lyase family enzyme